METGIFLTKNKQSRKRDIKEAYVQQWTVIGR